MRLLGGAAGLVLLAVGLIGFAHTKHGRPLLALLRGAPGCPVGMDVKLSPQEEQQARTQVLAGVRGAERAAARPALGFSLDVSTRGDIERWAQEKGVRCEQARQRSSLRCSDVPAAALKGASRDVTHLLFVFDGEARLVAIDASREGLSSADAAALVTQVTDAITEQAGPPAEVSGRSEPGYLDEGPLRRIEAEFRFSDYRARISATNLGRKLLVSEKYQSIPN